MVFPIIIRTLMLKNLAVKPFVCYDSTIPINAKNTSFYLCSTNSVFCVVVHRSCEVIVHDVVY